jgi:hypothetical protein
MFALTAALVLGLLMTNVNKANEEYKRNEAVRMCEQDPGCQTFELSPR